MPGDYLEDMRQMRSDGATLKEIGDHYGISKQRIHQILRDQPSSPNGGRPRSFDHDEAVRLWRKGVPIKAIAIDNQVSHQAVHRVIKAHKRQMGQMGQLAPSIH